MSIRFVALFCCLLCHTSAAETELGKPVLGFLFEPANGLQPIQGISGALTIGEPLDVNAAITKAVISPQQDYALAAGSDSDLLRVSLKEPVSVAPLGIPLSGFDLVTLSPSGSAAAFYDRPRNRVQVIAGLPAAPALAREYDLSGFPGVLTFLAAADDGDTLLAGFEAGAESLVALGSNGAMTVLPLRRATSASFLTASRDLVITDGPANEVYLVRDPAGVGESTLLAAELQGISNPSAIAVSKDGKRVLVASRTSLNIATIDFATKAVTITPCACAPTRLARMNGNAVFRVTAPSSGPIWLFDGDGDEPRMVFVPPYRPVIPDVLP